MQQRPNTGLKPMSEKLSSPDKLPVLKQITRSQSDTELKKQLDSSASQQQPYRVVMMTRPRLKINESMREQGQKSASEPGAVREKKTLPPIVKKPSIVVEPPCTVFSKQTFNDQGSHSLPSVENLYNFFTDATDKPKLDKIKTENFARVFF